MPACRRIVLSSLVVSTLLLGACGAPPRPPPWEAGKEEPAAASSVLPADPEAAFTALQERLLAARSIELAVEVESSQPYPSLLTGTLTLRSGNQLELAVDGKFTDQSVNLRLKSAGGRLVGGPHGQGDKTIDQRTPPALGEAVVIGLMGMGLLHNLALLSSGMPPDHAAGGAASWVVTSEHTWDTGRDATIDGRATRALGFQISVEGQNVGDATLWLDAATGLPVKREVRVHFSGESDGSASGTMRVSETYLKFEVSP